MADDSNSSGNPHRMKDAFVSAVVMPSVRLWVTILFGSIIWGSLRTFGDMSFATTSYIVAIASPVLYVWLGDSDKQSRHRYAVAEELHAKL